MIPGEGGAALHCQARGILGKYHPQQDRASNAESAEQHDHVLH